jgi:stage II sporulation protein D
MFINKFTANNPNIFISQVIFMKTKIFFFIISLVFFIPIGKAENVRVAVFQKIPNFVLNIEGKFKIVQFPEEKIILKKRDIRGKKVVWENGKVWIGADAWDTTHFRIVPYSGMFSINNRVFQGTAEIFVKDEKFLIINHVDIEIYLNGVLAKEVSDKWPIEALKAQAIASRTYAVYRKSISQDKPFDMTDDIYSQVYGGKNSEKYRSSLAVKSTQGLVLHYKNKIFPAFFHASCGGSTENAANLWDVNLKPLGGRRCPFCKTHPHYSWKKNVRLKDIQDKLKKAGYDLWLIKKIKPIRRNRSGRIETLEITTRDKKKIQISGKDFRNIIGPNEIRSNNYKVIMKGYYADIVGKGWGHGVGLCQWGAYEMALRRYRYDRILKFYYPGVKIVSYENK